jgi:hypothetical protein
MAAAQDGSSTEPVYGATVLLGVSQPLGVSQQLSDSAAEYGRAHVGLSAVTNNSSSGASQAHATSACVLAWDAGRLTQKRC